MITLRNSNTSARHPLQDAFDRVDRAVEHIEEFKRKEASLGQFYHDALVVEYNSDPPHNLSASTSVIMVDSIFGILLGEIAYNLRAALDYLVFQIARRDSGTDQTGTQFPICDIKGRFDGVADRFLIGINAAHRAAIERLQPYSGCDWTPILRDISNPDKHCRLADRTHGFIIHMSTHGFDSFMKMGSLAPVFSSKRRAMHPTHGREMDVYLSTEIPVIVDVGEGPRPVAKQVQELKTRVADTLMAFRSVF
jgi:hypothetical protein